MCCGRRFHTYVATAGCDITLGIYGKKYGGPFDVVRGIAGGVILCCACLILGIRTADITGSYPLDA